MRERLGVITITAGETGTTLSTLFAYHTAIIGFTIVGVELSPNVDDGGLTLDINLVGGSELIGGVAGATLAAPGTWKAADLGGTNTAVRVAAGGILSFDANNAAANTMVTVHLFVLWGEV